METIEYRAPTNARQATRFSIEPGSETSSILEVAIFVSPVLTYFVGMGMDATCTSEARATGSKFVLGPLGALFISLLMFGLGGMLLTWMIGDQYWGTVIPTALCWGWIGVWGVGLTQSGAW